jgi:hypothetical protein
VLVTMNTVFAGPHPETGSPVALRPGDVVDLPEPTCRELIAGKYAFDHVAAAAAAAAEGDAKRQAKAAAAGGKGASSGSDSTKPARKKAP